MTTPNQGAPMSRMILGEGIHGPNDRLRRPLHRRVSVRDQAVRRLARVNRAVTALAVAGAGLFALVAARTAPGRTVSTSASRATSPPAPTAGPATATKEPASTPTIAPVTAAVPTTRTARMGSPPTTVRHGAPVVTSPPTTARTVPRPPRPVPTTAAPVVVSGGS